MENIEIRPGSSLATARAQLADQIYPLPVTIKNDTNVRLVLPRWYLNLGVGEEAAKPIEIADLDAALRLVTDLQDMLVGSRDGTFTFMYPDPATLLITDTQNSVVPPDGDPSQGHLCLSTLLAMAASLIATQRTIIHLTNQEDKQYEEVPYVNQCC